MTAWLLFFGIGLAVFVVRIAVRTWPPWTGAVAAGFSGTAAGGVLALARVRVPTPGFELPIWFLPWIGLLAGALIAAAEQTGLFRRPLLRFFTTPVLGFSLAFCGGLSLLAFLAANLGIRSALGFAWPVSASFLVIGFVTAFGYTFPRNWFHRFLDGPVDPKR
jgi:hypothetical protein